MHSIIRRTLPFVLILLHTTVAVSQPDTATNSFETTYKEFNPSLHYKYDEAKQTHDYSNNWDLDKDGKADQVYFVGTGGAHLYYYLRVVLSIDNKVRNFPFLQSDLPILPKQEELQQPGYQPNTKSTFFAVSDHGSDKNPVIFIRLDQSSFSVEKDLLKKKGVSTNLVLVSFRDGKAIFKGYTKSN